MRDRRKWSPVSPQNEEGWRIDATSRFFLSPVLLCAEDQTQGLIMLTLIYSSCSLNI